MIEVVTRVNRELYTDTLDAMHQQRYRELILGQGWNLPGVENGRERDQFDAEDTVYLLAIDSTSRMLVGSARLNPTNKPHLMSEVFADQCELTGIPRADDIWELSRIVYDRAHIDKATLKRSRSLMRVGITEFCIQAGITGITWLTRKEMYASAISTWPTTPLGGDRYYPDDDAHYVAALSQMNDAARLASRKRLGSDEQVLSGMVPPSALDRPLFPAIKSERSEH